MWISARNLKGIASTLPAGVFLLALTGAGTGAALALDRPALGTPENAGLRSAVQSMSWIGEGSLKVQYLLQWTNARNTWVLKPREPVNISFWDTTVQPARPLSVEIKFIQLEPGFLGRKDTSASATVTAPVPPGATAVSLALGASGLETEVTALPAR